jgi:TetR/AcrR family tetracycline transcriptional repressor
MIVDAAIQLEPGNLTMQAVATRLGVDRKAVSYHVSSLDELVSLLTSQRLTAELERLRLPDDDWPEAVRIYAAATREVLLSQAALSLGVTHLPGAGVLMPAEALIERLVGAGFDHAAAGRALTLVSQIVFADARDTLLTQRHGQHPSFAEVNRVLADLCAAELPHLRRVMVSSPPLSGGPEQHSFDLEIVISGLVAWLTRTLSTPPPPS